MVLGEPTASRHARVLVAEHDPPLARAIESTLRSGGYEIVGSVDTGEAAIEQAAQLHPDLVVVDLDLAGALDGVEAAEAIARAEPVAIVFLASRGEAERVRDAHLTGPLACLIKPLRPAEVRSTVDLALRQKLIEAQLRSSERLLREVVEHASDPIFVADSEGHYVDVNQAACRMMGYERHELVGLHIEDVLAPEEHARLEELKQTLSATGESNIGDWLMVRKDGSRFPAEVSVRQLADQRWQAIVRDITRRKEAERQRAVWSAMVAHDLLQPVTAAKVAAEALGASLRTPRELRALRTITSCMNRLERMAEDLLDVANIDAQQLQLHRREVDLTEVARASVEGLTPLALGRTIELRFLDQLPHIVVDPERIGQVFDNLISNAIKYGEPGTPIRVELRRDGNGAMITVRNRGAGISAEDLPHLFERFHRTAVAVGSGVPGSGLGLHIARALVEAHGGTISAESEPDQETRFVFTLPLVAPAADDAR